MFPKSYKLFKLLGLEIRLDRAWVVVSVVLAWHLAAEYSPGPWPGGQNSIAFGIAGAIGLIGSLVLHELAHLTAAHITGGRWTKSTLYVFGGLSDPHKAPRGAAAECCTAAAGILFSLLLGALFWISAKSAAAAGAMGAGTALLGFLAAANLLLALFNLLPAYPLDAGRIVRALHWKKSGDIASSTRWASLPGVPLSYGAMGLGVLLFFPSGNWAGLWLFLAGFFLHAASCAILDELAVNAALSERTVAQMMSRNPVTTGPGQPLSQLADQVMLGRCVSFVPVEENGILLGYIDSGVLAGIDRDNWTNTTVNDVFVALRAEDCTTPETSAAQALDQLKGSNRRKLMVVQDNRLAGVISLSDLMGYLDVPRQLDSRQV